MQEEKEKMTSTYVMIERVNENERMDEKERMRNGERDRQT